MRRRRDIAIIGAGIGGLTAAALLARQGQRVTVFDQFDAPRPIGSGLMLQATGLAVLEQLGLRPQIDALGSPIERLWGLSMPSARPVLDVRYKRYNDGVYGLGVQRALVFGALLNAALKAGVILETNHKVTAFDDANASFTCAGGKHVSGFDICIFASGAQSHLGQVRAIKSLRYGALWATLPWPQESTFDKTALAQRYIQAKRMAGVMASGRTHVDAPLNLTYFWSMRADEEPAWRAGSLEAWKAQAAALWPETQGLLDQLRCHDDLIFARYRHHTLSSPILGPRAVAIGDMWHATSPQLGQGANMAMLDAFALAQALEQRPNLSDALSHYRQLRRAHIRLYQSMSWMFTPVYQGDSTLLPMLRDWLAAPLLKVWPAPAVLGAMVAGDLGRPRKILGLNGPA